MRPRVKLVLFLSASLIVAISFSTSLASLPQKFRMGTRVAASLLLNGSFPKQWLNRTGGKTPPKSLTWPLPGRYLGRGFGSRNGTHRAIDITAPIGTPIRVAEKGVVGYADNGVRGYGKLMLVLHPGGWVTLYAHLDGYRFKPGKRVSRGQIIGVTGNTGISRGPHLHFALIVKGKPIDPVPFMSDMPRRRPSISSLTHPFL